MTTWTSTVEAVRSAPRHTRSRLLLLVLLMLAGLSFFAIDTLTSLISPPLHAILDFTLLVAGVPLVIGLILAELHAVKQEAAASQTAAVEAERLFVSRELHDCIAQQLSYLHLKLDQLSQERDCSCIPDLHDQLEVMREVANEANEELYRLLFTLRLNSEGALTDALRARVNLTGRRAGLQISVTTIGTPLEIAPAATEQIVQIAREALANVEKHAAATHVELRLVWSDRGLRVIVQDNGRGFDVKEGEARGHFGLRIMAERAASIGSAVQITSTPGSGATVELAVPLSALRERTPQNGSGVH